MKNLKDNQNEIDFIIDEMTYLKYFIPIVKEAQLRKIRVNKPWSDPTINVGDEIFTEAPNNSDVGFNMNKGRIVTSPTKDWFSGHYGGTPYCTGTISEGDVDPNPIGGEFEVNVNVDFDHMMPHIEIESGRRRVTNTGSFFGGLPCYQSYGVVSGAGNKGGFQGDIRSRMRAEEWCAGAWNTCDFNVSHISAPNSGTGVDGRGPKSGSNGVQPSNGLVLYRELGHPRLGVARHDGSFFLGAFTDAGNGQTPISLTHYDITNPKNNTTFDIKAKGDDTPDNIANNIKYKENISNFVIGADLESSIYSTLPGKNVSVEYTRHSRSDSSGDETFKISINKPMENDPLIKEQISQYWECAEMVIFNKQLQASEVKKIRSYLYYKYTDKNVSTQYNIGTDSNTNLREVGPPLPPANASGEGCGVGARRPRQTAAR